MDMSGEAMLILGRLGRERDPFLEEEIVRILNDAYQCGQREVECRIAIWGDVDAKTKVFILRRDR